MSANTNYIVLRQGQHFARQITANVISPSGVTTPIPQAGSVVSLVARANPADPASPAAISLPNASYAWTSDGVFMETWATTDTNSVPVGIYAYELMVVNASRRYLVDAGRIEIAPTANRP